MKKVIHTDKAPAAIGPYSQAIEANGMLFISGQIPVDPATGIVPEGIKAQTEQVMNIVTVTPVPSVVILVTLPTKTPLKRTSDCC